MQRLLLLISAILFGMSWLSPYHYSPWLTFPSELCAYASVMCLVALYIDRRLYIHQTVLPLLGIACLPVLQWFWGIELYFSKALLVSIYLFSFCFVVVLGSNLAKNFDKAKILQYLSLLLFIVGILTSSIALIQWLDLENKFYGIVLLQGNRPYANFAQPNNMATFLLMSVMAAFYLFEKRILPNVLVGLGLVVLLFTIALSQSRTPWIACFLLTFYILFKYKYDQYRLSRTKILLWAGFYIACVFSLPLLNSLLLEYGLSHSQMSNVVDRASSSHSRVGIWMQMLYALSERPWLGYGWNQTSIAQLVGEKYWFHPERTNSAHNIVLEILVWNGVVIGTLICSYLAWWLFQLNKVVKTKESLVAMLMILSILIHALLEFPQNYAYFLFPLALLLGYLQSDQISKMRLSISGGITTCILVGGILLYGIIWRDYLQVTHALSDGSRHSDDGVQVQPYYPIYLLNQYQHRAQWYYLDRFSHLKHDSLKDYERAVLISPSHYDLFKYAQLLAFNGKQEEAIQQLKSIEGLYQVKHHPDQLLELKDHLGNELPQNK